MSIERYFIAMDSTWFVLICILLEDAYFKEIQHGGSMILCKLHAWVDSEPSFKILPVSIRPKIFVFNSARVVDPLLYGLLPPINLTYGFQCTFFSFFLFFEKASLRGPVKRNIIVI